MKSVDCSSVDCVGESFNADYLIYFYYFQLLEKNKKVPDAPVFHSIPAKCNG